MYMVTSSLNVESRGNTMNSELKLKTISPTVGTKINVLDRITTFARNCGFGRIHLRNP